MSFTVTSKLRSHDETEPIELELKPKLMVLNQFEKSHVRLKHSRYDREQLHRKLLH